MKDYFLKGRGFSLKTMQFLVPETKISGTELTILNFWQWGFSNILTNSLRGIFAEFLVGAELGVLNGSRIEWDEYDLFYNGKKIEIKSAAYIQAWYNGTLSRISFNIGAKKVYDYNSITYSSVSSRNADIYVFSLLKEKDPERVNPLDTEQWEFYVVSTNVLNERCTNQKTITLSSLKKFSKSIPYKNLKNEIDAMI